MSKLSERTIANMDFVLEETCSVLPNGGRSWTPKIHRGKIEAQRKKGKHYVGRIEGRRAQRTQRDEATDGIITITTPSASLG